MSLTKINSLEDAVSMVKTWQQSGFNVVFTNGVFDVLHVGHLRYLNASKALGDKLIIALNSDESVKKLKGDNRPINTLADRMELIAGFEPVDLVISFEEETPFNVINALIPDVITKGGDYTPDTVVGADIVTENGGEVIIINFEEGYSSTSIIEKL
ncbi:MAG: D-glycero-beta-D-manno-heptose 1-phosphate adenylyltransferase [Saprospiraceae bacterium]|jgi:rfaE bifunctional protein nucleotidyltransferase chain/domain|uniref:D-glycero-beta-D-manno-heptose 1-phosphate adenylyltransferase n=1 Tax=Candidatus Brachybacter algidus TaxID=2982024 RepID=UPI001B46F3BE|nr:D-glycero-beta-D-manno-heptose 1-phosphate adenylyltransferase [Candidatus Brachybacter algidus]MBP7306713.1 D-glycero-beta-D-manno-heptose 1-phosphate adenylyltransferase [Saprospiraceae bacterium]